MVGCGRSWSPSRWPSPCRRRWRTSSAPPTGPTRAPDTSVTPPAGGQGPEGPQPATRRSRTKPAGDDARGVPGQLDRPRPQGDRQGADEAATRSGRPSARKSHQREPGPQAARLQQAAAARAASSARSRTRSPPRATTTASWSCPGIYTEPKSRRAPTNDPKCATSRRSTTGRTDNGAYQSGAVSYAYQVKCPNDQNLIAVMGRRPGRATTRSRRARTATGSPTSAPASAATSRSRARASRRRRGRRRRPGGVGQQGPDRARAKDVGIRADRADGFVLRNMTVRHVNGARHLRAREPTATCSTASRPSTRREYGVLTFVEDHGLMQNCEAAGTATPACTPAPAPRAATSACRARAALHPGDPLLRHAPQHRRATRAPAATPSGCTTTTSTTTRSASRPTCSPPRGTRASRRTRT